MCRIGLFEGWRDRAWKKLDQNCWISNVASLSAAPGYWDQCGVHAAVDADHGHVHHLQVVGHQNIRYIFRNFLKYKMKVTGYFLFTKY